MVSPTQQPPQTKRSPKRYTRRLSIGLAALLLFLGMLASLSFGAADIPFKRILTAFTSFDDSTEHIIIRSMRLPRTLIASMVGASLAVAGALMQGLTQNPVFRARYSGNQRRCCFSGGGVGIWFGYI